MLFDDLCLKIYFWPFLSYWASIKGLCPAYPNGYFPNTTLPPYNNFTTLVPTFQPTPPTTTLPPCPDDPLVCFAGGERPIPYCPCIDPRQQNGQVIAESITITTAIPVDTSQSLQLRLAAPNPTAVVGSDMMIFSQLDSSKRIVKRRKREVLRKKN